MLYLVTTSLFIYLSFLLVNAPSRHPSGRDLHSVFVNHDEVCLGVKVQRADPVVHSQGLECGINED